jgi:hypothetical protein
VLFQSRSHCPEAVLFQSRSHCPEAHRNFWLLHREIYIISKHDLKNSCRIYVCLQIGLYSKNLLSYYYQLPFLLSKFGVKFMYRTEIYSCLHLFNNPLNAELNPICQLLALLGAHHILHVSRISVKSENEIR